MTPPQLRKLSPRAALLIACALLAGGCATPAPSAPPPPPRLELPLDASDHRADLWLRRASPTYARMVREIRARPEVSDLLFRAPSEVPQAAAVFRAGNLEIQVNPEIRGARRLTLIAFEVANAYRQREHDAIDRAVDQGVITTAAEFGLAHELYEYEALRLHRQVLLEVEERVQRPLPAPMFMTTPPPPSAKASQLPDLLRYLEHQRATGHTAHYERWFERRRKARVEARGGSGSE